MITLQIWQAIAAVALVAFISFFVGVAAMACMAMASYDGDKARSEEE